MLISQIALFFASVITITKLKFFYDLDHKTTYRAKLAIVTVMLQL